MNNSEKNLKKISVELITFNAKINLFQDVLYEMKNELDLIKKSRIQGTCFSQMTKIADKYYDYD